jgi:hypothetical protein
VEPDGKGVGGPLIMVEADLVIELNPAAFLNGEGVQENDQLLVGEIAQVIQNGFAVGLEKSSDCGVHDHHHTNYYNAIVRLLNSFVKEFL